MAELTPLRTCTNEAEFSVFLVEIADQITKKEVDEMKFLCNSLPRGRLEEIKEPREFVNCQVKKLTFPGQIMPSLRRKFTNSRDSLISSSLPLGNDVHRNFISSTSFFVISSAISTKKTLNSASFVLVRNRVSSAMLVNDRSTRRSWSVFLRTMNT